MTCASLISFLFLALFGFHSAYGMDCNLGQSKNVIDQFINSCPRPLIDSQDESYCCWTSVGDNMKVHCCDGWSFVLNSISLALPIIIICLVVSFIVSCICCLCCPCCCVYKRRSGGSLEQLGLHHQVQQQQLQIQQQQLLLQQQQLELEKQRQEMFLRQQSVPCQYPPPYDKVASNSAGVFRQGPVVVTVGPYAVPPTAPYQPLSDGHRGYAVA